jgi:hypothetical protein
MRYVRCWILTLTVVGLTPSLAIAQSRPLLDARIPLIGLDTMPLSAPARGQPIRTQQVKGRDSLRNGAIIGALIGGLYGALGWGRVMEGAGAKIGVVAAYTAGGALIGACIDARHAERGTPMSFSVRF